jgi:hypothetical protein|tara:strand:- start:511 stop:1533 length:1023 start_codon:yes stop_codon:yes gene_type:complete
MRNDYLLAGIKYINSACDLQIDEAIIECSGREFEKSLMSFLPGQSKCIEANRKQFLSSEKAIKFSNPNDEFLYLIIRNILVSNYLLKSEIPSHLTKAPVKDFFTPGILKINSEFSQIDNMELANLIKDKGSLVFKNKQSLARNFSQIKHMVRWIEGEIKGVLQSIFNVSETTINQQFKNNTFLQIAPVSPKDQNMDHQSDFHMDTFFPALKWWYFPKEVSEANGPFQYLISSASPRRELYQFFRDALSSNYEEKDLSDVSLKSHNEGSLRGDLHQSEKLFGSKAIPVTCSAGTLVIGNVMGLHARGYSKIPENRFALHGSFRSTVHDQYSIKNLIRGFVK